MSKILNKIFKSHVENTFGNDFEEFIMNFFLIYYGQADFTSVRRVKDEGSDGIITSEDAIVACYGPEQKATQANFNSKSTGDHSSYLKSWSTQHKKWWFVHNRTNSPASIQKINKLGQNTVILGVEEITKMFNDLNRAKQRRIAKLLNIDEDHFSRQYIKEIVEDILSANEDGNKGGIPYEKPLYIEEKFRLNFSEDQIDQIKEDFDNAMDIFDIVIEILGDYEAEGDLEKLKARVLSDIGLIQGDISFKINSLVQRYEGQFNYSDDYLIYIRALLLYLFEQCLFGIKTEEEKAK